MSLSIRSLNLKTRMILVLGFMVVIQTGLFGPFAISTLDQSLNDQIAERALHVAKTVAAIPQVIEAIETGNAQALPALAADIAEKNEALFVVIGNREGIRLAHPTPAKIGQPMYDDDGDYNEPALVYGKPYTQIAIGSLGPSMRGKTPVFDSTGEQVIGIVSVGFQLDAVQAISAKYRDNLFVAMFISLTLSVIIGLWFTWHLQKAIFGLEPEQIGSLFQERNATLASIREGIIAVDTGGMITTFNKTALDIFGLDQSSDLSGKYIRDVLPGSRMLEVLQTEKPEFDKEIWIGESNLIANRIPVFQNGKITGVVSSFRLKNELDLVSQKLTDIQAYADSLRSQSHEYANKLHTIAGLIEIGNSDAALALIGQESRGHQDLLEKLVNTVSDPVLSGLLLGKYNRARELGLRLVIDPESSMHDIPDDLHREQLVSVLGNLIDNALEATKDNQGSTVTLTMTDLGQELIFEIEDQGQGLSESEQQQIFDLGYSSKAEPGHGFGLHLVQQLLSLIHGHLTVENTDSGCRFTLYIRKDQQAAA